MILLAAVITALVALARGGRIRDFSRLDIRHVWVFPSCVVLLGLLGYAKSTGQLDEGTASRLAQPGIYLIVIMGLILNRHIQGTLLLASGTFLNFLVIALNRGYMPVSLNALAMSGLSRAEVAEVMYLRHAPMDSSTVLWFLGDVIPMPLPGSLKSVGSVGDVVALAAMVLIVWRAFFPRGASSAARQ